MAHPDSALDLDDWERVLAQERPDASTDVISPALALFESAWLAIQDRLRGRIEGPTQGLEMPEELRRLCNLGSGEGWKAIVGATDKDGNWQPGIACMDATEAEVFQLMVSGWRSWEIRTSWEEVGRRLPTSRRRKGQPSVESIERYGRAAWAKARKAFGQMVDWPEEPKAAPDSQPDPVVAPNNPGEPAAPAPQEWQASRLERYRAIAVNLPQPFAG